MLYEPTQTLLHRWFADEEIRAVARVDGGTVKDVFRVDTARGVFVLRIAEPGTRLDDVLFEQEWVTHIGARLPEVLAPLPAPGGSTAVVDHGRVSTLLPYVPGDAPSRFRPEHRAAAAHTLARIHRVAASVHDPLPRPGWPAWHHLHWERNHWWCWDDLRRALPRAADAPDHLDPAAIAAALGRHIAVLPIALHELAYRGLPAHPLHGDYGAANLRVRDDRIVGVFDWDETRLDWRACELADAIWGFARQVAHDGFDREVALAFLESYREAGGEVSPRERDELVLLMRARRLWEALYFLGDWQRGQEISWDYLAANVRALDALEGIEAL